MSQWLSRDCWPDDPFGHVYLLRAVDMIGAAKLGEQWRPPPQPAEETAVAAAELDRAWVASEEFLTVSRLVADACADGELDAVQLDGAQIIVMDRDEWLREHSREGDACFRTGHVFLPTKTKALPVFLRSGSLKRYIAGLASPASIAPAVLEEPKQTAPADVEPDPAPLPSAGGRPTDRDRVIREAHRQIKAKEPLPKTLTEWAGKLEGWLDKQPNVRRVKKTGKVMTAETIEGHVRSLWDARRQA